MPEPFASPICVRELNPHFSGRIELLHIHRQSAYLIGRDRAVVDLAVEHPSCSKQHAVIQCASPPDPEYYVSLDLPPICPQIGKFGKRTSSAT